MLQTISQLPKLPWRRLESNRHKCNGFLSKKSVAQVQAARGWVFMKAGRGGVKVWVAWELSRSQQSE